MLAMFAHPISLLFVVGLNLTGEAKCPSRYDVSHELALLAPASQTPDGPGDPIPSAEVERGPAGLSITLRAGDGGLVAHRIVTASGSCAELAKAVAIVITAWLGDLRPDLGPGLPVIAGLPAAAGAETTTVRKAAPLPEALGARPLELGAALLASAAGRDVAPGLTVAAQLGRVGSGLGLRVGGTLVGAHAVGLGAVPGQARWSRFALGLGLRYRLGRRALILDSRLGVQGGLARLEGAGFDHDYTKAAFDAGVEAGMRLGFVSGRLAPFLEIGAAAWTGKSALVSGDATAERRIPSLEVSMAAGVAFGRFR